MTFPETPPSAVTLLRSTSPEGRTRGVRVVAEVYWAVVYRHLRLRFHMTAVEAEDTLQAFFLHLVETELAATYDPSRGRFRSFLRQCLENFAISEYRKATAQRRRGNELDVDFATVEASLGAAAPDASTFDRDWVRRVAEVAVERLLAALDKAGKSTHAELFRRFHLHDEPPSYQAIADELGIKITDVTNWLHATRREFRHIALALLREITASEQEFADEAREVFGIDVARDWTASRTS